MGVKTGDGLNIHSLLLYCFVVGCSMSYFGSAAGGTLRQWPNVTWSSTAVNLDHKGRLWYRQAATARHSNVIILLNPTNRQRSVYPSRYRIYL